MALIIQNKIIVFNQLTNWLIFVIYHQEQLKIDINHKDIVTNRVRGQTYVLMDIIDMINQSFLVDIGDGQKSTNTNRRRCVRLITQQITFLCCLYYQNMKRNKPNLLLTSHLISIFIMFSPHFLPTCPKQLDLLLKIIILTILLIFNQKQKHVKLQKIQLTEGTPKHYINQFAIKIMSVDETLRATILKEADTYGSNRRFGLFSSPISTAIGDDGPYKTKLHPRNEQGKPQTQLRGVFTNPPRSGQLDLSYFTGVNSLAASEVKDEYIDPDRKLLLYENQIFKKGFNKDQQFKPASGFKEIHTPTYEFKEENNPEKNPKRNREQDGKVRTAPRNAYTNLQTTVIKNFFKPIKYMEDPYERAQQQQSERHKRERSLEGEAAFKLNLHPKGTFDKEIKVYGSDVQSPEKLIKQPKFNIYKHENRWKTTSPNKEGFNGFFSPFPPYKENPAKQIMRKPKEEGGKQQFRRMSIALSRPSPSIAYHPQNLMKTISHSVSYRQ